MCILQTIILLIDNRKRAVIIVIAADSSIVEMLKKSSIVDEEGAYLDFILYLSFCAAEECVIVIRSHFCSVHDLHDILRRKH
jgi:hypothetical protein